MEIPAGGKYLQREAKDGELKNTLPIFPKTEKPAKTSTSGARRAQTGRI